MKNFLLVFLINVSLLSAQSAGNAGMAFLKYGISARNIAMGDLGVVSSDDPIAAYYNPALAAVLTNPQVMFTHSSLIQDVSSQNLAAGFILFNIPFVVGVNTTSVPGIEVRTQPGVPQATFDANYFFGSISTGIFVSENLSAGLTIKYLYENIFSDKASGFAFDVGIFYKDIIEGLNFGASLRNVGSMNKLREIETELPVDLRFGASYGTNLSSINSDLILQAGYQKYTATDDNHIHIGSEIIYNKSLAFRGGYITGYDSKGLTAGLGLLWGSINFDYAFTPFEYGLGNAHTISLTYNFH